MSRQVDARRTLYEKLTRFAAQGAMSDARRQQRQQFQPKPFSDKTASHLPS